MSSRHTSHTIEFVTELPTLLFLRKRQSGASRRMESLVAWVKVTQKRRLRVIEVDVDRNPALVRELEVTEFPSLVLIKDRQVVARLEGRATGRQIDDLIRPHLAEPRGYENSSTGSSRPLPSETTTEKEFGMPEIASPRELFLHELGDILYVERELVEKTLPKLIGEVQDAEFKKGLEKHLDETRQHVKNVEQVFRSLDEEPEAEPCLGFEGLRKEHDKLMEETSSALVDLVDLGAAARTESYEIAAYEALRRMAKALGEEKAVGLLDENLQQEKEALREVEKIATRVSNESTKQLTSA